MGAISHLTTITTSCLTTKRSLLIATLPLKSRRSLYWYLLPSYLSSNTSKNRINCCQMIALRTLICRLHKLQINSRIVVALCSMRNSGEAFSRLRASFRMNLAPSRSQMLSLKKPDRAKLVLIISRVRQRGSPSLNMKPHHRRYTRCQHHRQSKACCQKFSSQLAPWNISCFLRISFCPRPKNLPIRYFH